MITLETNYGPIKVELDYVNTPLTAKNFLEYAKSGFYDDTLFHRVIDSFMIQGGGFDSKMDQKKGRDTIENEADKGQPNNRGTLAMARTGQPHSASSQFFINLKDNTFLNFKNKTPDHWGYCVFGKVVEGMDVVDKIAKVKTTSRSGHQDVPVDHVVIERVVVEEDEL